MLFVATNATSPICNVKDRNNVKAKSEAKSLLHSPFFYAKSNKHIVAENTMALLFNGKDGIFFALFALKSKTIALFILFVCNLKE